MKKTQKQAAMPSTKQQQQKTKKAPVKVAKRHSSTTKKSTKVVILGPPGSGKGTISKKLVKDFEFAHISTGDLLRKEMSEKSELGTKAHEFISAGKLVPDDLVIDLVTKHIQKAEDEQRSILLDGFPRTLAQAEALDKKVKLTTVLDLRVPDSEIVERATSRWTHLPSGRVYSNSYAPPKVQGKDDVTGEDLIQREDDKLEVVSQRLNTYHTQTHPLLDYYKGQALLNQYDGAGQPDLLAAGRRSDAIYVDLKNHVKSVFDV